MSRIENVIQSALFFMLGIAAFVCFAIESNKIHLMVIGLACMLMSYVIYKSDKK